MKAVVISGGKRIKNERALEVIRDSGLLVCADKGAEYAASYGVNPDFIIGDMDSVDNNILSDFKKSKIIVSPREKNYTDTHLAVKTAIEQGAEEIDIICATGLRSDHAIANIRLLLYIHECGAKGRIVDDDNTIFLCTGRTVFNNKTGTTVSIMAISEEASGISLKGFRYPLSGMNAGLDWTTGISNVIISEKAEIHIKKGKLLVFEIHE